MYLLVFIWRFFKLVMWMAVVNGLPAHFYFSSCCFKQERFILSDQSIS